MPFQRALLLRSTPAASGVSSRAIAALLDRLDALSRDRSGFVVALTCHDLVMDRDYCLDVPSDFDDSAADSQVHPMARLMFFAQTNAEVFRKAQQWATAHDVRVTDVSWDHYAGEDFAVSLTIYFSFELEPEP